jgi:hypothetical protein
MECSYDYVTHVTTLILDDVDAPDGNISYSYTHSISPTGGEEMYLFSDRDPDELRGNRHLKFIMENLYFDPHDLVSAVVFVDFNVPTLKELQLPAFHIEQSEDMIRRH